jgi:hypothetical protein
MASASWHDPLGNPRDAQKQCQADENKPRELHSPARGDESLVPSITFFNNTEHSHRGLSPQALPDLIQRLIPIQLGNHLIGSILPKFLAPAVETHARAEVRKPLLGLDPQRNSTPDARLNRFSGLTCPLINS